MVEAVGVLLAGLGRRLDELLAPQRVEVGADLEPQRDRDEVPDRRCREVDADHRRRLDHRPLGVRQGVEPGREQRGDRRRDVDDRVAGVAVAQHGHDLLDVERVALGGGDHPLPRLGRQGRVAEEQVDHGLHRLRPERVELDQGAGTLGPPVRVHLRQLTSRRADDEHGLRGGRADELVQQVEERRLRPVDVVDHHDEGTMGCLGLEELAGAPEELADRMVARGQADGGGDAVHHGGPVDAVGREQRADLVACDLRRVRLAICAAVRTISTSGQKVMPLP